MSGRPWLTLEARLTIGREVLALRGRKVRWKVIERRFDRDRKWLAAYARLAAENAPENPGMPQLVDCRLGDAQAA